MKARKCLKWLAAGLVMVASMVLLGCPHNNLIEHDVVSGSGATSGRGSNGGVKLVITNFTDNSAGTNRANNAVLNPLRTIAPDHIDIKANASQYVFVAEGISSSGQKYDPAYITVDPITGEAALGISGSGVWTVTVSAYEVAKLVGKPGVNGNTNVEIMTQTPDVSKVTDQKAAALILQGKATLNLGMNTSGAITVTLTNDGVGTQGNVQIEVNFDAGDYTKLNSADYKVNFGLYNFETGELVQTGAGAAEEDVEGDVLANPQTTGISDVPKGRYQFRVTIIENNGGTAVAYWADDIIVEGNRNVTQQVTVSKLFEKPAAPTAAGIYWSQKETTETREGFLGYLSWNGMPFNAVGVDVQIANITKWYSLNVADDQMNLDGTGAQNIVDHTDLWTKIDARAGQLSPSFEDIVTELKWSDVPQKAKQFPAIYKSGSVLNGSNGVVFLMQTGQVYSVRIRAAGARDNSDWLIINDTSVAGMGAKPKMLTTAADNTGTDDAKNFNTGKLAKGLFDLVMLKYDLEGKYELAKTNAGPVKGTKASTSDLVVYSSYGDPISIALKYTDMGSPQEHDWFLYPIGGLDINARLKGWKGWNGVEEPSQTYVAPTWGNYSGHKNLTLVTVGGDASVKVESETAGTFNVLTEDNVLVALEVDGAQSATVGFNELANGGTNPNGQGGADVKNTELGIQKDGAGNRYILNVDNDGTIQTWLYVSVGSDPAAPGILDDKNSGKFTVKDIKVTLLQNGVTAVKQFTKGSDSIAFAQMDGLQTGTYTLRVEVLGSSGYWVSYQTALAIKNDTQVIQ